MQELGREAEEISIRSEVLRLESQALRNILFDGGNCMPFTTRNITFNDLADALDTTSLFEDIEMDNSSDSGDDLNMSIFESIEKDNELFEPNEELSNMDIEEKDGNNVIDGNKERPTHLDKTNELIDQVNLLAKTTKSFFKEC